MTLVLLLASADSWAAFLEASLAEDELRIPARLRLPGAAIPVVPAATCWKRSSVGPRGASPTGGQRVPGVAVFWTIFSAAGKVAPRAAVAKLLAGAWVACSVAS